MVALLFTAIFIVGLVIALYFWAPRQKKGTADVLPPTLEPRGLFDDPVLLTHDASDATITLDTKATRASLTKRAKAGDKSALIEAQTFADQQLYFELLDLLKPTAEDHAALLSLVSFVRRHNLPVNAQLAEVFLESWKRAPDRSTTAVAVHLAALTDNAKVLGATIESAFTYWQNGLLEDITAPELQALFDGEFWLLSAGTRSSGAGFILKHTLARVRQQLSQNARSQKIAASELERQGK